MKRWLMVAAIVITAVVVAVIITQVVPSKPKPDVKWLHDYAWQMSTQAMLEPHPTMQYVFTTVAKARAALAGQMHLMTVPSGVDLCLAILHGHFTYVKGFSSPSDSTPPPKGTTLVLIVDARTHDHLGLLLTSGSINTKALGHPSHL